jgi:hypothetical protein
MQAGSTLRGCRGVFVIVFMVTLQGNPCAIADFSSSRECIGDFAVSQTIVGGRRAANCGIFVEPGKIPERRPTQYPCPDAGHCFC